MTRLILLVVALGAITGMGYGLWVLNHRRTDATQYENELTEEWDDETTVLDLPAPDLVGTISDHGPDPDAGQLAAEVDLPGSDEDAAGTQVVFGVDAGGSGFAEVAVRVRLTPKQRRRALHKGRIPRNLPGPSTAKEPYAASPSGGRAGELVDLRDGPPRSTVPEVHHERHERIPHPLMVEDAGGWWPVFPTLLESARHEAHFRQWEAEMRGLIDGAYAWLEQVPA